MFQAAEGFQICLSLMAYLLIRLRKTVNCMISCISLCVKSNFIISYTSETKYSVENNSLNLYCWKRKSWNQTFKHEKRYLSLPTKQHDNTVRQNGSSQRSLQITLHPNDPQKTVTFNSMICLTQKTYKQCTHPICIVLHWLHRYHYIENSFGQSNICIMRNVVIYWFHCDA